MFPEYTGGADPDAAVQYIRDRFIEVSRQPKDVFVHILCATKTDNARVAFDAVCKLAKPRASKPLLPAAA